MREDSRQYDQLRKEVLREQKVAVQERKRSNPLLTPEEKLLGVYAEELEPQVREAVFDLHHKGYPTFSSGFYDADCRYQTIEGMFRLEEVTTAQLEERGVEVLTGIGEDYGLPTEHPRSQEPITIIQFRAASADLPAMVEKWREVMTVIPQRRGETVLNHASRAM